jgi:hypothetical protein
MTFCAFGFVIVDEAVMAVFFFNASLTHIFYLGMGL